MWKLLFWGWGFILLGMEKAYGQEEWNWKVVFDRPYLLVQKTTNIYSGELEFKDRREVGVMEPLAAVEPEVSEGRVYYRTERGYLILAGGAEQSALWERNGIVVLLPGEGERVRALVRELCRDRVFLRPAPGWDEGVPGEAVLEPYEWVRVRYVTRDSGGDGERVFAYVESAEGEGWVFMNSLYFGMFGGNSATAEGSSERVGGGGADFDWGPEAGFYSVAVEEASARERIWRVFEIYNGGVRAARGYFEMMYGRRVPARTLAYTAEEGEAGWRIVVSVDEGSLALEAERELYRTLRQVLGGGDGNVVIVPPGGGQGL